MASVTLPASSEIDSTTKTATFRFYGPSAEANRDGYVSALGQLAPGSFVVEGWLLGLGCRTARLTIADEVAFLSAVRTLRG